MYIYILFDSLGFLFPNWEDVLLFFPGLLDCKSKDCYMGVLLGDGPPFRRMFGPGRTVYRKGELGDLPIERHAHLGLELSCLSFFRALSLLYMDHEHLP